MIAAMAVIVWRLVAILCVLLAVVGVVLPVLPTVPFLLLAAAAASRGWPWLDNHLTSHAVWGPHIVRWRERGAVPRRAKWFATLGMSGSALMLWLMPLPQWLQIAVPLLMLAVGWWIWLRPEE